MFLLDEKALGHHHRYKFGALNEIYSVKCIKYFVPFELKGDEQFPGYMWISVVVAKMVKLWKQTCSVSHLFNLFNF